MRLTNQVTFLAAFLFMAACAYGQDVHYNYDRSANFAAYKTYQWVEIPGGAVPDQLIDQAIKRAAEEQLAQKGLTRVENNADLYIGYQFVLNLEKSVSLWETGGAGPGWGWDPWGGGRKRAGADVYHSGRDTVDGPVRRRQKAVGLARRRHQDHQPQDRPG